jgi:hypothetical protein
VQLEAPQEGQKSWLVVAVLVGRAALGCAGDCGAAARVGAWLRAQRRPGLARLCARPLSAPQETIRRDVSGRCVRGALVFYLKLKTHGRVFIAAVTAATFLNAAQRL